MILDKTEEYKKQCSVGCRGEGLSQLVWPWWLDGSPGICSYWAFPYSFSFTNSGLWILVGYGWWGSGCEMFE